MYAAVITLLLGCLAVGVVPGIAEAARQAGRRFLHTANYTAAILGHAPRRRGRGNVELVADRGGAGRGPGRDGPGAARDRECLGGATAVSPVYPNSPWAP